MDSYMYIPPGIFYVPPTILENEMALLEILALY